MHEGKGSGANPGLVSKKTGWKWRRPGGGSGCRDSLGGSSGWW